MPKSSDRARAAAERMVAEQTRLEAAGVRATMPIMRKLRVEAVRRYRAGGDPQTAIVETMRAFTQIVQDGMVAADLQGRARQAITAAAVKRARSISLAVAPYDNAIDFLTHRLRVPDSVIQDLIRQYRAPAVEVVASAGEAINRAIGSVLLDVTRKGLHERDGVTAIRRAFDSVGVAPGADHLLATTYRTQTQLAYSVGRLTANADPAIQEILWGYEYVTVGDDRVRPAHAALDGFRAKKDDPAWRSIMPPNGWNCRCSVIEIWQDDDIAVPSGPIRPTRIDGELVTPGADEGWDFNPAEIFAGLT